MAYDIRQFTKLGLLHELITGVDADSPPAAQIARVKERLAAAIADIRKNPGDLTSRLNNPDAKVHRAIRSRSAKGWQNNGKFDARQLDGGMPDGGMPDARPARQRHDPDPAACARSSWRMNNRIAAKLGLSRRSGRFPG